MRNSRKLQQHQEVKRLRKTTIDFEGSFGKRWVSGAVKKPHEVKWRNISKIIWKVSRKSWRKLLKFCDKKLKLEKIFCVRRMMGSLSKTFDHCLIGEYEKWSEKSVKFIEFSILKFEFRDFLCKVIFWVRKRRREREKLCCWQSLAS